MCRIRFEFTIAIYRNDKRSSHLVVESVLFKGEIEGLILFLLNVRFRSIFVFTRTSDFVTLK